MFDIHCHILPGVDDGARNIVETKKMLEMAWQEGIERIIATPHFNADMRADVFAEWNKAYKATCKIARRIDHKFKIHTGAEIYYDSRIPKLLEKRYPITLNKTKYILLEFSFDINMTFLLDALFELQILGYLPIMAHIERYQILHDESNVKNLTNRGIHLQVNASTLLGKSGTKVKNLMLNWIQKGYIDFIATDAHGIEVRRPQVRQAIELLDKKVGSHRRELLCRGHFNKMIIGENLI